MVIALISNKRLTQENNRPLLITTPAVTILLSSGSIDKYGVRACRILLGSLIIFPLHENKYRAHTLSRITREKMKSRRKTVSVDNFSDLSSLSDKLSTLSWSMEALASKMSCESESIESMSIGSWINGIASEAGSDDSLLIRSFISDISSDLDECQSLLMDSDISDTISLSDSDDSLSTNSLSSDLTSETDELESLSTESSLSDLTSEINELQSLSTDSIVSKTSFSDTTLLNYVQMCDLSRIERNTRDLRDDIDGPGEDSELLTTSVEKTFLTLLQGLETEHENFLRTLSLAGASKPRAYKEEAQVAKFFLRDKAENSIHSALRDFQHFRSLASEYFCKTETSCKIEARIALCLQEVMLLEVFIWDSMHAEDHPYIEEKYRSKSGQAVMGAILSSKLGKYTGVALGLQEDVLKLVFAVAGGHAEGSRERKKVYDAMARRLSSISSKNIDRD